MHQEMPGSARLLFNVYCITDDQIFLQVIDAVRHAWLFHRLRVFYSKPF